MRFAPVVLALALLLPGAAGALDPEGPEGALVQALADHARCPILALDGLERCEAWAMRHDELSAGPDDASALAVGPDGTVYTAGLTDQGGMTDALVVAREPLLGLPVWTARLGTSQEWEGASFVTVTGGRLLIGGDVVGATGYDYYAAALDPATGALLWESRYDAPARSMDFPNGFAVSPDGSRLYITGESVGATVDVLTVAFSTLDGDVAWVARYDGSGAAWDQGHDVAVSPDGTRVVVAGSVVTSASRHSDALLLAYDAATGELLDEATYDGPDAGGDAFHAVAMDSDGSAAYASGYSYEHPFTLEIVVAAWDLQNGISWATRYGYAEEGRNSARAIAVSPDGSRVAVAGESDNGWSFNDDRGDIIVLVHDAATGEHLWIDRYNGPVDSLDRAADLAFTPDGSRLVVTGTSETGPTSMAPDGPWWDATTLLYDAATGERSWVARYNGPLQRGDSGHALDLSPDASRVYVAGQTEGADGTDFLTLAYDL